jgi:hypothetical protein
MLTAEAAAALVAELVHTAKATIVHGATVVLWDEPYDRAVEAGQLVGDPMVPGVVIFEDGTRRLLGRLVSDQREGDGIVAAAQARSESARAAVTPGPAFVGGPSANGPFPPGDLQSAVAGPWRPIQTGEAEWRPWCEEVSAFEARAFPELASCERRCWWLNRERPELAF